MRLLQRIGGMMDKLAIKHKLWQQNWANYVLKTNRGDALRWGLEILRTIGEYLEAIRD